MPQTYEEIKFSKPQKERKGKYFKCLNCNIEFYLSPSFVKESETTDNGRGKFCSRKCQKEYTSVEKVCQVCGKTFKIPQGIADRYSVCSWDCRKKSQHEIKCARCGKYFLTSETRYKRVYCSEECRRPAIIEKCATCGKEFRRVPSDTDNKFCSFSCYRKFTGESSLEKLVREYLESMNVPFIQEKRFGRYSIDFFLENKNTVLEIEGDYWHQNASKDQRKNDYLESCGLNVIRIKGSEINSHGVSVIHKFITK